MPGVSDDQLVLGLDIGGTKLAASVVGVGGRARSFVSERTPVELGWEASMNALVELGHRALTDAEVEADAIVSVGVGCGGPLDSWRGVVCGPPNLPGWDEVPVTDVVREAFQCTTFLENDANAAALATALWGRWAATKDLVYLTISTGMGGGVLVDGQLLRGVDGNAAEIGHLVVDWRGRLCECGQRGCVEAYVSGSSIARRATEALDSGRDSSLRSCGHVTAADVSGAAALGDPLAVEIWDDTVDVLAAAIRSVLNIFEPELVVLGGGVTEAGAMLIDPVRARALPGALSRAGRRTELAITPMGPAAGAIGAAAVAVVRTRTGLAA